MTQAWAVAVYWRDQGYGGPEEGGWWYTTYELSHVEWWYHDQDEAYEHARQLNDDFGDARVSKNAHVVEVPRRELRPDLASVACHVDWDFGEEDYILRWDIPEYEPEGRPHYC
jgi:hypothetical protein